MKTVISTRMQTLKRTEMGLSERIRDRVIVVLALKRSGHHAVVNQLCYQIDNVTHLNDCAVMENGESAPRKGRFRLYDSGVVVDAGKVLPRDPYRYTKTRFTPNLVYSFENAKIWVDYSLTVETHRSYTTICVVRDPFNWLASILQRRKMKTMTSKDGRRLQPEAMMSIIEHRISLWKKQVTQCLCAETYPYGNFVDVNFNRWILDRVYRQRVSDRLGLDYSEQGLNEVVKFARSSFDGTSFQGKASDMKVLERYKSFEHDEKYRSFFIDRELVALSEQYFEFNPW